MAFVFSIGTAVATVNVDATVLNRATEAPVPNCLLVFDLDRTVDSRRVSARTDVGGRSHYETSYMYGGSILLPFQRDRDPDLRFYLGEPPRYGTFDQTESWDVRLRFRQPFAAEEVVPTIDVQRNLAHEDMMKPPPGKKWQQAGFDPIPTEQAGTLVRAKVGFETTKEGREAYRIPLTVLLDKKQIDVCQAEAPYDLEKRAVTLYNAERYAEALAVYQEAARVVKEPGWAYRGMGDCLGRLERRKEAAEAYRRAVELTPNDADTLYWYANSLIAQNDKEAVLQFNKLVGLEPQNARGFIGLANALFELNRSPETIAAFDRAIKLCATCLNDNDRVILADAKRLAAGGR
jgi:tetratricopeptide (TPR) repeat protein